MNNKWSEDELAKLVKLIKEKKSLMQIGSELNRSENAVRIKLSGIIFKNIQNHMSVEDVAKSLNMTPDEVETYHKEYNSLLKNRVKSIEKDIGGSNNTETKESNKDTKTHSDTTKHTVSDSTQKGGKKEKILSDLEYENRLIKSMIDNKVLHRQLNKLIREGKITPDVKLFLKQIKKQ